MTREERIERKYSGENGGMFGLAAIFVVVSALTSQYWPQIEETVVDVGDSAMRVLSAPIYNPDVK